MNTRDTTAGASRREFVLTVAPAGALACLCGDRARSLLHTIAPRSTVDQDKFDADSEMSFQQVYNFAFAENSIPLLKSLGEEMPEGDYLERLKRASARMAEQMGAAYAKSVPTNDLAAFTRQTRERNRFWEHVLTLDIVEDTESAFEIKVTECLWAKIFRENDAADIGYATICHGDFAMCRAFNPRIRMERTTTRMQGHDRCDHRWVWEGDRNDR